MAKHPARHLNWTNVESSNVLQVAYDNTGMYVRFRNGTVYRYDGVSRQRAIACRRHRSVGEYINGTIKPNFPATLIG